MIRRLFATLCLIFTLGALGACGRTAPHFAVAAEFSPDERAEITRAAAKWNTIVRVPVSVDGGSWRIIKANPPTPDPRYVGWTDTPSHTIWIRPGVGVYAVILHELGHAQGLHHVAGPGVMNPNVGAVEFSPGDMEECRKAGACGMSDLEAAKCRLSGACS